MSRSQSQNQVVATDTHLFACDCSTHVCMHITHASSYAYCACMYIGFHVFPSTKVLALKMFTVECTKASFGCSTKPRQLRVPKFCKGSRHVAFQRPQTHAAAVSLQRGRIGFGCLNSRLNGSNILLNNWWPCPALWLIGQCRRKSQKQHFTSATENEAETYDVISTDAHWSLNPSCEREECWYFEVWLFACVCYPLGWNWTILNLAALQALLHEMPLEFSKYKLDQIISKSKTNKKCIMRNWVGFRAIRGFFWATTTTTTQKKSYKSFWPMMTCPDSGNNFEETDQSGLWGLDFFGTSGTSCCSFGTQADCNSATWHLFTSAYR